LKLKASWDIERISLIGNGEREAGWFFDREDGDTATSMT